MSPPAGWGWYPRAAKKKAPPKRGIKIKKSGTTWWGQRWIESLENLSRGYSNRLARGRTYARAGRTHDLVVEPGHATAKVTGSRSKPYTVRLRIPPLSEVVWDQAITAMAAEARFTAELLAGRMPQEIDAAFYEAEASLFPAHRQDLQTSCSCPDGAVPCKHVAATHYVLGEALDRDPFLLFELRGRTKDQVLDALRGARAGGTDAGAGTAGNRAGKKAKKTNPARDETTSKKAAKQNSGSRKTASHEASRKKTAHKKTAGDEPARKSSSRKKAAGKEPTRKKASRKKAAGKEPARKSSSRKKAAEPARKTATSTKTAGSKTARTQGAAEPRTDEVPSVALGKLGAAAYDEPREPLPSLRLSFEAPSIPGAVLQQLGAPRGWRPEQSPAELLAPVVRAAAARAREVALAEPARDEGRETPANEERSSKSRSRAPGGKKSTHRPSARAASTAGSVRPTRRQPSTAKRGTPTRSKPRRKKRQS